MYMLLSNVENWFPLLKRQLVSSLYGFQIELCNERIDKNSESSEIWCDDICRLVGKLCTLTDSRW
jgi:hypothetical protein